jgi:NAD(P)H dehydrogenase (quinone)
MKIAITGASGKLGKLILKILLTHTSAQNLVAIVRNPEKVENFRLSGVEVRRADYSQPETLYPALKNVDRLLLISSSEIMGDRAAQHEAVIRSAIHNSVQLIVYTSILQADRTSVSVLGEHRATEARIRDSGIPSVILRNGWYIENYTDNLPTVLALGALYGASGDGRVAAASREDLAEAAARVLIEDGHAGKTYELAGSHRFTKSELADAISRWSHRKIDYNNLSPEEYRNALAGAGLPAPVAQFLMEAELAIAADELNGNSSDLHFLIGRNSRSLHDVLNNIEVQGMT